jgi:hypothetical protein
LSVASRLFVVTDTFAIADRGLVLAPGPVPGAKVQFGDVVELRRADGTTARGRVVGLATTGTQIQKAGVPMMLAGVGAQDAPAGTEVWSVDDEA